MVIRGEVKASTLEHIYDICNRIFNNDDCFYTKEELEQEQLNKNNVFLTRGKSTNEIRSNSVYNLVCNSVASAVC